jgi:phytol kinase
MAKDSRKHPETPSKAPGKVFPQRETQRQFVHIALGIFLIALLFFLGKNKMLYFLSGTLFLGFLLINLVVRGYKVPIASWFVETFERKDAPLPGYGSAWYVIGLLLSCLLIPDINFLAATIVILAFGDAASTIFGRKGTHSLPYNPRKTFEGSSAFFLFSLIGYLFIGWKVFPLALVAAVVESLPIKIDDNLTIPLACVIVYHII